MAASDRAAKQNRARELYAERKRLTGHGRPDRTSAAPAPGPRAYGRAPRIGERVNCGLCLDSSPDDYSCEDCSGSGHLSYEQAMSHFRFKQALAKRSDIQ